MPVPEQIIYHESKERQTEFSSLWDAAVAVATVDRYLQKFLVLNPLLITYTEPAKNKIRNFVSYTL